MTIRRINLYWSQLAQKKSGADELLNREATVRLSVQKTGFLFFETSRPVLGVHSASIQWATAVVTREWSRWCVQLATHFSL
jgi:hypothetical protein